ncbi:STAS domain-containing protein [Peptostreptococcus faecalis]|uniref:STAS domain-containing protein n=1 Tax=Peptostreptococcus faecalis TaxID=2045015 RepID=UPI000C7CAA11|nr:STAS domain-containing protein [Peptostreptococcus faecalis]
MSLNMVSNYENNNDIWTVKLSGELDISSSEDLTRELNSDIDKKISDIKLDMSNLDYIDSTGIGAVVVAMKRLKENNKEIYIYNAKDNVKKIFRITGLDQIIRMEG